MMGVGVAVLTPTAGVGEATAAIAVCVPLCSTSAILEGSLLTGSLGIGVVKRLFVSIGVLVTAGGVEYGCSQADNSKATRISVEAMVKPRFVRDMDISSISNKSFSDGSISVLTRQVSEWDIGWMLMPALEFT